MGKKLGPPRLSQDKKKCETVVVRFTTKEREGLELYRDLYDHRSLSAAIRQCVVDAVLIMNAKRSKNEVTSSHGNRSGVTWCGGGIGR